MKYYSRDVITHETYVQGCMTLYDGEEGYKRHVESETAVPKARIRAALLKLGYEVCSQTVEIEMEAFRIITRAAQIPAGNVFEAEETGFDETIVTGELYKKEH